MLRDTDQYFKAELLENINLEWIDAEAQYRAEEEEEQARLKFEAEQEAKAIDEATEEYYANNYC